jgi:DNA-binding MurR/RpiR family transcriptional regulator
VNSSSLVDLIRARYNDLSRSERRVADQLLGSTWHLSGSTATELARSAQVSKATVTRFVAKLGLSGFDDFRQAARNRDGHAVGSPLQLMAEGLATTHGDLRLLIEASAAKDHFNLTETYAELPIEDVAEAVRLLVEARALIFADFRKQYTLAYYAATVFRVVRPRVSTLPILGASPVDGMLDIGPEDVVVMFPFRRPERDQDLLSRAVVESGARLLTIGDIWPSPASDRADVRLRCRSEGVGVVDSFVAPMSLINLLLTATANALGTSAHERLERLEAKHQLFETFGDAAPRARSRNGGAGP